jgi:hypothetical protein
MTRHRFFLLLKLYQTLAGSGCRRLENDDEGKGGKEMPLSYIISIVFFWVKKEGIDELEIDK